MFQKHRQTPCHPESFRCHPVVSDPSNKISSEIGFLGQPPSNL